MWRPEKSRDTNADECRAVRSPQSISAKKNREKRAFIALFEERKAEILRSRDYMAERGDSIAVNSVN